MRILIGTYTNDGRSEGIYGLALNPASGALSTPSVAVATPNPTFLALSPKGTVVCATSEVPDAAGQPVAGLRSFSLAKDGTLAPLSAAPVAAKGTSTHVAFAPDAATVFTVHYNAAWVASLPIDAAGKLGAAASVFTHEGATGPNSARQDKPHAHSITLSPDGRHAYVCDLGLDIIRVYTVDAASHRLTALSDAKSAAGLGPRHAKFSADGAFLYVVNELTGSLSVYSRKADTGALCHLQTVSLLADGFTGENTSAEVQLHPNGRFVYATSRGPDIITVLERNPADGTVKVLQRLSSGGRHPRHFALSPDGAWLVCANRDTNNLASFAVDAKTGLLTATGFSAVVPQPVCVLFVP